MSIYLQFSHFRSRPTGKLNDFAWYLPVFDEACLYIHVLEKNWDSRESWRRTLFDVLDHRRRAKIAFSGCAFGADRWRSSAVSHDRTASYRRHDSWLSQFFFARVVQTKNYEWENKLATLRETLQRQRCDSLLLLPQGSLCPEQKGKMQFYINSIFCTSWKGRRATESSDAVLMTQLKTEHILGLHRSSTWCHWASLLRMASFQRLRRACNMNSTKTYRPNYEASLGVSKDSYLLIFTECSQSEVWEKPCSWTETQIGQSSMLACLELTT